MKTKGNSQKQAFQKKNPSHPSQPPQIRISSGTTKLKSTDSEPSRKHSTGTAGVSGRTKQLATPRATRRRENQTSDSVKVPLTRKDSSMPQMETRNSNRIDWTKRLGIVQVARADSRSQAARGRSLMVRGHASWARREEELMLFHHDDEQQSIRPHRKVYGARAARSAGNALIVPKNGPDGL